MTASQHMPTPELRAIHHRLTHSQNVRGKYTTVLTADLAEVVRLAFIGATQEDALYAENTTPQMEG